MSTRTEGQILRSRGIGAGVGTLIGVGWMVYGLRPLPDVARVPLGLLGLLVIVPVLIGSVRLIASSRRSPAPDPAAHGASRRVWGLFWLNFAAEIVLLNVAINLLAAPALRIYWIPAISLVVGLHFLPMAWFFGVPSYRWCGGAMVGVAAVATAALKIQFGLPATIIAVEAIANAVILWLTAASAIRDTGR